MVSTTRAQTIPWATSVDEAIARAKTADKMVLLDFFSPT